MSGCLWDSRIDGEMFHGIVGWIDGWMVSEEWIDGWMDGLWSCLMDGCLWEG